MPHDNDKKPLDPPEELNARLPHGAQRTLGSRLLSGGLWMVAARMVSALSGLLVSMLLARMLSSSQLGAYFIVASIAVTGAVLSQFGAHQAVVRLIAAGLAQRDLAGVRRSMRSVAVIALGGVTVVAGGYLYGAGDWVAEDVFGSPEVQSVVALTAVWIALRHAQTLLAQTFRGFHDLWLAAVYEGGITQLLLVFFLTTVWILGFHVSLELAIKLTISAFAITVLSGWLLLRRHHVSHLPDASGLSLGPTLRLSAPLFVSSASIIVLGEMHLWILGAVASAEQVALYGAGYRLMQLVLMPLSLVNHVIPPAVADLHSRGELRQLARVMRISAAIAAVPSLLLLVFLVVFSADVLQMVYGEDFRGGAPVVVVMAAGQAINVFTGSPGVLLSMSGQQSMLMRISLVGGLFGILASLLLVWDLGALGTAMGYAIGLAVQNVIMVAACKRRFGIKTYAGLPDPRSVLFWLRGEMARRMQRGGIYLLAERMLRPMENRVSAMAHTRVIECMGDSHANIFIILNRSGCVPGMYFRGTVVQGASALGLANSNSRTNALGFYNDWIAKTPAEHILLFMLGEVDVGYLVWQKSARDGVMPGEVMAESLRRYFDFLSSCLDKGYKIALVTVPLPAVRDGPSCLEMQALRPGLDVSQQERTSMTLEYNLRIRQWAFQNDVFLVDLDAELLDPSSGLLREEFYKRDKVDNHLDPSAFSSLLCRKLGGHEFEGWVSRNACRAPG